MNDNQRAAVLKCLSEIEQEPLHESAARLLERACDYSGVKRPIVSIGPRLVVSRKRVELPESATVLTVLHVAGHLATPGVFPPHGAEFCSNLLTLTDRFAPWTDALLQQRFIQRRVHYTAEHRRKAVLKAVLQRAVDGTEEVCAVLDDPPQQIVGGPVSFDKGAQVVRVGGEKFELHRLRYLAKIR